MQRLFTAQNIPPGHLRQEQIMPTARRNSRGGCGDTDGCIIGRLCLGGVESRASAKSPGPKWEEFHIFLLDILPAIVEHRRSEAVGVGLGHLTFDGASN